VRDSNIIIILVGSGDLTQATSTSKVVGSSTHPSKNPPLALFELASYVQKYVYKLSDLAKDNLHISTTSPHDVSTSSDGVDEKAKLQRNILYLDEIISIAKSNRIPLYVLYFPYLTELQGNQSSHLRFKAVFLEHLYKRNIPVIDTTEAFRNLPSTVLESYYRDPIHINEKGNKVVSDFITKKLCYQLGVQPCSSNKAS
jgi:hypothetical protein